MGISFILLFFHFTQNKTNQQTTSQKLSTRSSSMLFSTTIWNGENTKSLSINIIIVTALESTSSMIPQLKDATTTNPF